MSVGKTVASLYGRETAGQDLEPTSLTPERINELNDPETVSFVRIIEEIELAGLDIFLRYQDKTLRCRRLHQPYSDGCDRMQSTFRI